ncbi:TolC family protein [Immundisolibacter sp.]
MFLSSIRRARLCAAVVAALGAPFAAAAEAPGAHPVDHPGPHFTLAEALAWAQARHPLFASYRAQLQAADARAVQAGIRPAPTLNLTIENALGTGEVSGYSAAETTLGFSQLIERGGLRDRRIEAANAGRERLSTDAEIARLDLRAEVARRFVHVLSDQAQLGITREATGLARSTLAEVERRVAAARAPLAERSRAQISLERARLDEEHAEHELASSRRHLAGATGSMEVDFGQAEGDLLHLPPVADFEVLLRQLQTTPDALRFASEARLRESELRLAQARRTPGLTLGAGIRRQEATDDVGLMFSASMPLFGASRERGNVLESDAQLAQVGPERELALLRTQAQLNEIWQELNHARVEVEAQRERVVPAVEQALDQTRYAYERGRYSLLELRDAQA